MRSGRARFFGACGVAVVFAAGLVGCGGESSGGPTPAAQSSTASSSSDAGGSDSGGASDGGGEVSGRTPNLPPENAALEAPDFKDYTGITYETDQGAQETVRYFFDAMYYGYSTGDVKPFESVADASECEGCAKIIDDIESWKASGAYLTPSKNESGPLERMPDKESYNGRTPVYYRFDRSSTTRKTPDGKNEDYPAQTYEAAALLEWRDDNWVVVGISWRKVESNDT